MKRIRNIIKSPTQVSELASADSDYFEQQFQATANPKATRSAVKARRHLKHQLT